MRQAIIVKYIAPTNTKPTRIKARCLASSVTLQYDHSKELSENGQEAVKQLIKKLGWQKWGSKTIAGVLPSGEMCFVFVPKRGEQ